MWNSSHIAVAILKSITLTAQVTADIIHYTAAAILCLFLAANHRIGTCIGMVVPAKHEIEACAFNRRDDLIGSTIGTRVRSIDGLVRHKNLPYAISGQILGNVRKCLGQLHAIVYNDHTNLAILHLVPTVLGAYWQVINHSADLAVRVTVVLMVTHNMDHIHAIQHVAIYRSQERTPVANIVCHIVDGITGLNGKVITRPIILQAVQCLE